jgi:hypothetical protein
MIRDAQAKASPTGEFRRVVLMRRAYRAGERAEVGRW